MAVKLEKENITLTNEEGILKQNLDKINELNNNAFFSHPINNKIGREFVLYLSNLVYGRLNNPEPVNLRKNTLSKTLRRIQVIDNYVNKPLDKYSFNDLNNFMRDFMDGKIQSTGNRSLDPKTIGSYLRDFKRYWKIYRQYILVNDKKSFDELFFDWGTNLKAPRVKQTYEDFTDLRLDQVISLADNLHKEEYKVRTLVSVNLMGRKCELNELKRKDIDIESDDVYIKLPQVKKHSTEKTSVGLYTFVKKPLMHYLEHNDFNSDDLIFPSKESAYAKNLKEVSERLFKKRVNPKTLRKIGVSVADELGVSRSDIERIGAWEVNSPVLAHYFNRKKKVKVDENKDNKINTALYSDVYAEFDKVKLENEKMAEEMKGIKEMLKQMALNGQIKKE